MKTLTFTKTIRFVCLFLCFACVAVIGAIRGFHKGRICFAAGHVHEAFLHFGELCRAYPNGETTYLQSDDIVPSSYTAPSSSCL